MIKLNEMKYKLSVAALALAACMAVTTQAQAANFTLTNAGGVITITHARVVELGQEGSSYFVIKPAVTTANGSGVQLQYSTSGGTQFFNFAVGTASIAVPIGSIDASCVTVLAGAKAEGTTIKTVTGGVYPNTYPNIMLYYLNASGGGGTTNNNLVLTSSGKITCRAY